MRPFRSRDYLKKSSIAYSIFDSFHSDGKYLGKSATFAVYQFQIDGKKPIQITIQFNLPELALRKLNCRSKWQDSQFFGKCGLTQRPTEHLTKRNRTNTTRLEPTMSWKTDIFPRAKINIFHNLLLWFYDFVFMYFFHVKPESIYRNPTILLLSYPILFTVIPNYPFIQYLFRCFAFVFIIFDLQ